MGGFGDSSGGEVDLEDEATCVLCDFVQKTLDMIREGILYIAFE